jgi:hypothetical protein
LNGYEELRRFKEAAFEERFSLNARNFGDRNANVFCGSAMAWSQDKDTRIVPVKHVEADPVVVRETLGDKN